MDKIEEEQRPFPPDEEIEIYPSTPSGPGGSGKDTSNTGVAAHWLIHDLTPEQIKRLRNVRGGKVIVVAQDTRSQLQNRKLAIERIRTIVAEAMQEPKEHIPTHVPRSEKAKRVANKRHLGETKRGRGPVREW